MSVFRFKKFNIQQKYSAAKVGTDGVLLGAWTQPKFNPKKILDIGCGTGLISLMMAQRFVESEITAIEIDEAAYQETLFNFAQSDWNHRLYSKKLAFQNFTTAVKFDLIISNPPFYKEDTSAKNLQREMARNVKYLSFESLISRSAELLNINGVFAVIIPFERELEFLNLAEEAGLYANKVCRVKGSPNSIIKRSLLSFSKIQDSIQYSNLVIEKERHVYTHEYINLTQDFYLKM